MKSKKFQNMKSWNKTVLSGNWFFDFFSSTMYNPEVFIETKSGNKFL